ncbi:MAG: membrane protein insertase YidC [Chloroflexi bacterium]|nr:membrane protein insertase YidC [Chloroflexota bacterium]
MAQQVQRPTLDPKQVRRSLITWAIVAAVLIVGFQIGWGTIWREGLVRPFLNALLFLYAVLGQSFVLAITVFTLALRLITSPLQIKQIRAARKMQELQPQLQELQKRFGGDKERLVREQQKLYREAGVNPLGGCLPTLIQLPIWIVLYRSINSILADTPLELMALGKDVYTGFAAVARIVPLQSHFLWLNLAQPDPYPILPILVGGTMWLQQRMMTQTTTSDPQQASMNQTMQIMMPLMFGYFTTQFASGLALYFVISNVVGIVMQWAIERIEQAGQTASAIESPESSKGRGKNEKRQRSKK